MRIFGRLLHILCLRISGSRLIRPSAASLGYEALAREPEQWLFADVAVTGVVVQVMERQYENQLRLRLDGGDVLVSYSRGAGQPRLLEQDTVTVYGRSLGTATCETVSGGQETMPILEAEYLEQRQ